MNSGEMSNWTTVIKPRQKLFTLNLKDLWTYRDLVKMFIHRDFVTFYKQTILGPLWFIIQPLFTSGMFTIIFGKVAKISTDEMPQLLFYMAGVINWSYFAEGLSKTSDTFIANAGIFGKVYFPRLTVPLANVIAGMIRYLIQYCLFLAVFFIYFFKGAPIKPNWMVLFTPLLLLQMALLSFGVGIWISSVTTKYRDLKFVLPFFIQLWMYASPIVYPFSLIPNKLKIFVALNPIVPIIEVFKKAYLGAGTVDILYSGMSIGITLLLLFSGIIVFNRIEKNFMDTV